MPSTREQTPNEKLIDNLRRRVKPASIVVELADGKTESLELGALRGRWERVCRNLDAMDWTILRCYAEPEGKGALLDTATNPEAAAEEEPAAAYSDDPMVQVGKLFDMSSKHVERLIGEIRKADETYEASRNAYILNLTERNTQLETLAGQSLARLQEAVEMIVQLRTSDGGELGEKEKAFIGAADALGAKAGFWNAGTLLTPHLPGLAPASRGNGSADAATAEDT